MKRVIPATSENSSQRLLLQLGEELKQPLIAISQLSEVQGRRDEEINAHAQRALQTIENALLYQRIYSGQIELQLEPVHIGSAIQEVAHRMAPLMKLAGSAAELKIQHGLSPVTADRRLLFAGLQSLWQAFIVMSQNPSALICQAHKTSKGIRLSLQSSATDFDMVQLSHLKHSSTQPLTAVAGPATDIIVAHGIFGILGTGLTKSNSKERSGLGATLKPSQQLQMV